MLLIALEPEAASIFVQYLPMERNKNGFGMTKEGTRYMVVDIGGMYINIYSCIIMRTLVDILYHLNCSPTSENFNLLDDIPRKRGN